MTKKSAPEAKSSGGRQPLRLIRIARLIYEAGQARVYGGLAGEGFPEIRPAHSAVFRHIDPLGTRASDLALRAGITKQSIAYLVEGLEADGFLETVPDPADGRARLVRLTARGRAAYATLERLSENLDAELSGILPAGRLDLVREDLAAIVNHLAGEPA
ncbi:MAG: winged helix-turn-helix transcriptional regulator [Rhodobacterales bacterium]|nr:winged helix-turn-helix transcriptional regulator [Rhodobacterales bacterium]